MTCKLIDHLPSLFLWRRNYFNKLVILCFEFIACCCCCCCYSNWQKSTSEGKASNQKESGKDEKKRKNWARPEIAQTHTNERVSRGLFSWFLLRLTTLAVYLMQKIIYRIQFNIISWLREAGTSIGWDVMLLFFPSILNGQFHEKRQRELNLIDPCP